MLSSIAIIRQLCYVSQFLFDDANSLTVRWRVLKFALVRAWIFPYMSNIDDLIQMEKLYFWSFEPFK